MPSWRELVEVQEEMKALHEMNLVLEKEKKEISEELVKGNHEEDVLCFPFNDPDSDKLLFQVEFL
jgi:ssRNA-specific RNase YbeY (16S rRNA maturation enzyme)